MPPLIAPVAAASVEVTENAALESNVTVPPKVPESFAFWTRFTAVCVPSTVPSALRARIVPTVALLIVPVLAMFTTLMSLPLDC